jgi:protein XagA
VLGYRVVAAFIIWLCVSPSTASAGAWTMPEGKGQFVITGLYSSATRAFGGDFHQVPRYSKFELQGLLEYGLTKRLTLIVSPSLQHVDIGSPMDAKRTGFGYSEVGARYLIAQYGTWVLSAQATARLPGIRDTSNPAAIGYTGYQADVRALIGKSFSIGGMPAFVDLQFAQRFSIDVPPSEWRGDFTLGIRPTERWLLLVQSFNVISEGSGPPLFPSYEYYKLQFSAVYSITPSLALQAGGFTTYAGRNALQENGGILGVWYKF